MLYTKDRDYKSGKMNEFGGPSATQTNLTIFGKSTFEDKINTLFSGLLTDISTNSLTIQQEMLKQNFKSVDQTNFNNQFKTKRDETFAHYFNELRDIDFGFND
jgi:hypothetical protein